MPPRVPGAPLHVDKFERFDVAEMDRRCAHLKVHGVPAVLHAAPMRADDPPWRFYKISVEVDRSLGGGAGGFLDLCTPAAAASAPSGYHISIASREELERGKGDTRWRNNRWRHDRVVQALDGRRVCLQVHSVSETWVAHFSFADPNLGPVWSDLVSMRKCGLHKDDNVTMSM